MKITVILTVSGVLGTVSKENRLAKLSKDRNHSIVKSARTLRRVHKN